MSAATVWFLIDIAFFIAALLIVGLVLLVRSDTRDNHNPEDLDEETTRWLSSGEG